MSVSTRLRVVRIWSALLAPQVLEGELNQKRSLEGRKGKVEIEVQDNRINERPGGRFSFQPGCPQAAAGALLNCCFYSTSHSAGSFYPPHLPKCMGIWGGIPVIRESMTGSSTSG